MAHQIGNAVDLGFVDKRRAFGTAGADNSMRAVEGTALFTANATGTTTTMVGADAAPATNDNNVVRRGQRFKLFTSAGVLKQETIFTITNIASAAGSTTITFTPAATVAPVSTDVARQVDQETMLDEVSMDTRLLALGYTASQISLMTQNDKVFAIRFRDDRAGLNY